MTEKIFSCARFNLDALLSLAGTLRGRTCTCDVSAAPKAGSFNWVIFVLFDDGVEWVFRSPRRGPHTIVSDDSAKKMLISEAATLKYLKTHSAVPVPEVFSFRCDHLLLIMTEHHSFFSVDRMIMPWGCRTFS